jgi:hypothetical protein
MSTLGSGGNTVHGGVTEASCEEEEGTVVNWCLLV